MKTIKIKMISLKKFLFIIEKTKSSIKIYK